jgi:hypothetical protein
MGVNVPVGFGLATLRWQCDGDPEPQVTTFGFDNLASAPYSTSPTRWNTALQAAALVNNANMLSGWTWLGVWVDEQTNTGFIRYEFNTTVPGSAVGGALPTNCALLVQKTTALGGRKYKGRGYWPAAYLTETNIDTRGTIAGAQRTSLQNAMNSLLTALGTNNIRPMLLHSGPEVPTPIIGLGVAGVIATQRRRMR